MSLLNCINNCIASTKSTVALTGNVARENFNNIGTGIIAMVFDVLSLSGFIVYLALIVVTIRFDNDLKLIFNYITECITNVPYFGLSSQILLMSINRLDAIANNSSYDKIISHKNVFLMMIFVAFYSI